MASSMPFYISLLSLLALCAAGCSQGETEHGFHIHNVVVRQDVRRLHLTLTQDLRFSREAVNALRHGVPLTLSLDLELREAHLKFNAFANHLETIDGRLTGK